jgi:hypothetical protein
MLHVWPGATISYRLGVLGRDIAQFGGNPRNAAPCGAV